MDPHMNTTPKYQTKVSYTRGGSFGSNKVTLPLGNVAPSNCNRPSTVTGFRTLLPMRVQVAR